MDTQTESTMSTASREESHDAQNMLDWFVAEMLDVVIKGPYASMTEVLGMLMRGGPRTSRKNLIRLFPGPGIFKQTYRRMEGLCWAAVRNKLELLPLRQGVIMEETEEVNGLTSKQGDEHIRRWTPTLNQVNPFP